MNPNDDTQDLPPEPTGKAGVRVRAPAAGTLEPLFPATRLVRQSQQRAQRLLNEARERLAQASIRAREMIREANEDVTRIEEQAALRARAEAAGKLNELISNVDATVRTWTEDQSRQLASAAVRLAGTILRSEFSLAPERITELAAQTLARARHESVAALEMHPDDATLATQSLAEIAAAARYRGGLHIVASEQLPRGSVRLHTTQGMYDGSLATRLAELERLLAGGAESGDRP